MLKTFFAISRGGYLFWTYFTYFLCRPQLLSRTKPLTLHDSIWWCILTIISSFCVYSDTFRIEIERKSAEKLGRYKCNTGCIRPNCLGAHPPFTLILIDSSYIHLETFKRSKQCLPLAAMLLQVLLEIYKATRKSKSHWGARRLLKHQISLPYFLCRQD